MAERTGCLPGIPTLWKVPMSRSAVWQPGPPHTSHLQQPQNTQLRCLCRFRVASEALAAAGKRADDAERRITDLEQHIQNKRTAISELQDQVCQQHTATGAACSWCDVISCCQAGWDKPLSASRV